MYEEVIWNVYHSRQCSARLKMDRNSMELDYWWARLFSQQLLLSCSISDQCLYIKVSFKSHLNFAAYLELTPGASLLMVMTSQLRFLPIYTICTLSISNLDLLLFLLNFLVYYFNQIFIHWKNSQITALGFVCKILWGTSITLDGDGGFRFPINQRERLKMWRSRWNKTSENIGPSEIPFSRIQTQSVIFLIIRVHVLQRHYIFKPATLQGLWTAIQVNTLPSWSSLSQSVTIFNHYFNITPQTLHAISAKLKPKRNSILVGNDKFYLINI